VNAVGIRYLTREEVSTAVEETLAILTEHEIDEDEFRTVFPAVFGALTQKHMVIQQAQPVMLPDVLRRQG